MNKGIHLKQFKKNRFVRLMLSLNKPFLVILLSVLLFSIISRFFSKQQVLQILFDGFIFSTSLLLVQEVWNQWALLRDFLRLNGAYICKSYRYDSLMADDKVKQAKNLKDKDELFPNGSRAEVTYQKNSILRLVVTDSGNNVWEGFAVMDSRDVGCLTFYYKHLKNNDEPWRRNGVRRIGVLNGSPLKISLFSEDSPPHGVQRFGREILIKQ